LVYLTNCELKLKLVDLRNEEVALMTDELVVVGLKNEELVLVGLKNDEYVVVGLMTDE